MEEWERELVAMQTERKHISDTLREIKEGQKEYKRYASRGFRALNANLNRIEKELAAVSTVTNRVDGLERRVGTIEKELNVVENAPAKAALRRQNRIELMLMGGVITLMFGIFKYMLRGTGGP